MTPGAGERLLRFVGDQIVFTLRDEHPDRKQRNWRARLRTNLGRAAIRRREIISAHAGGAAFAGASWRDLPMQKSAEGWSICLPLAEVGFFKAKAYLLDEKNWQHWPEGADAGICVHPSFTRTANTIYCAFARLFGDTKRQANTAGNPHENQLKALEATGYATLPPSGKFRDLTRQLPHIVHQLGCRIIHLLPINPTPTTYARFGRYGSPYAALDLTAVDPALVEFDKRTTGIDQFCELTYAAHSLNARVFIDIVINHTGWGSSLQENHPEFFLKNSNGEFASPGAWGTVWEDLVELEQRDVALWDTIADSLIIWCRRGVDGFRCDAGYKIPTTAWQYIIARVQDEFPETIFLLEGLGGSWEATEMLLTEGGMHWAYSELFQNYSGRDVAGYLDYASRQSERIGSYVHYSETHDNNRLAEKGRTWSLLRNRLCALASPNGGFGFTCGVEWLATEKIRVHGNTGLNWGADENIVSELAQLIRLISDHPCFFDDAKLARLSQPDSPVYALRRESADGDDAVLVLANTEVDRENSIEIAKTALGKRPFTMDLLGQALPKISSENDRLHFHLPPGAVFCLAPAGKNDRTTGDVYRRSRAQAAFAIQTLNAVIPIEIVDGLDWNWLAKQIEHSPKNFLTAASECAARKTTESLAQVLAEVEAGEILPRVIEWTLLDARRITPVPPGHWLLLQDSAPFRATLRFDSTTTDDPKDGPTHGLHGPHGSFPIHVQSIPAGDQHIACFAPRETAAEAELKLERYAATSQKVPGAIRFLGHNPRATIPRLHPTDLVLLTNGIGGMARLCADLGRVNSKYDCALAANLNSSVPVDRHVFVKRVRVWVNADGFLSALNFSNLVSFEAESPAVWQFVANAGDGRTVEIELRAEMVPEQNTVIFRFSRPAARAAHGKQLPADADVRLTVRPDIEDRNFHSETKRNGGAEHHFAVNTHQLPLPASRSGEQIGFAFTPAADRQLRVFSDGGDYHPQPEWSENIPHPVEQTRGQTGSGDAYSPGWFDLPLAKGATATLVLTAELSAATDHIPKRRAPSRHEPDMKPAGPEADAPFETTLIRAAKQFVVRRDASKTVIAGYPWFLDWGRDSLICARGLLSAGLTNEVKDLLLTFAKFEQNGTLPNTIHGNDVSNRDTSDAPLWFAVVCEDLGDETFFNTPVAGSRTVREVLTSIAENYGKGTPNGIYMDAESALIWSPSHFTWMDTNYPAGTPREGYPVEIQALWIRLLRLLEKISGKPDQKKWRDLADRATNSFEQLFWLENQGWFADVLIAKSGIAARDATPSDALRSNCLLAVSLGLVSGERAKRCVAAAQKYLVVPGALRSLAPLPVTVPLLIWRDGQLMNNPNEPYRPRYEGDEDSSRKLAYHNGTAWTWTFPTFCEALARVWNFSPEAVATAKAYLASTDKILNEGCIGQLPEILDGDAPHFQRGCDAQAWGATEVLRVWKLLNSSVPEPGNSGPN